MEFFIKIKNINVNVKLTTILKITQKFKKQTKKEEAGFLHSLKLSPSRYL